MRYVEPVNPLWTTRRLQARVVSVWDETGDTRTLTMQAGTSRHELAAAPGRPACAGGVVMAA